MIWTCNALSSQFTTQCLERVITEMLKVGWAVLLSYENIASALKKKNQSIPREIERSLVAHGFSGVARAFPGGQLAHPESQNEEEKKYSLRKSKEKWSKFEEKGGKWNSCPPETVMLATALHGLPKFCI